MKKDKKNSKKKNNKKEKFVIEIKDDVSTCVPIMMCLGMSVGMCLGTSFDSIPIGMSMGLCFGLLLGTIMDSSKKNKKK